METDRRGQQGPRPSGVQHSHGPQSEKNAKAQDLPRPIGSTWRSTVTSWSPLQLPEGCQGRHPVHTRHGGGYNTSLQPVKYDPEGAKKLLAEAGATGMTLVRLPVRVSRPLLPDPRRSSGRSPRTSRTSGIKVDVVTKPWNGGYLGTVSTTDCSTRGCSRWTGDTAQPTTSSGPSVSSGANDFHTYTPTSARPSRRNCVTRMASSTRWRHPAYRR